MRGLLFLASTGFLLLAVPVQARFGAPIGDNADLSFHTYVGNDPANKADPSGKDPEDDIAQELSD